MCCWSGPEGCRWTVSVGPVCGRGNVLSSGGKGTLFKIIISWLLRTWASKHGLYSLPQLFSALAFQGTCLSSITSGLCHFCKVIIIDRNQFQVEVVPISDFIEDGEGAFHLQNQLSRHILITFLLEAF